MTYDVRTLDRTQCLDAIMGYELEKVIRSECAPAVADCNDAILSLKARLAELSGKKINWVLS